VPGLRAEWLPDAQTGERRHCLNHSPLAQMKWLIGYVSRLHASLILEAKRCSS
jgi:hypothetical protein